MTLSSIETSSVRYYTHGVHCVRLGHPSSLLIDIEYDMDIILHFAGNHKQRKRVSLVMLLSLTHLPKWV